MKEALKLALEALNDALNKPMWDRPKMTDAITAIKEALAQPEQEPVKYEFQSMHDGKWYAFHDDKHYADTLADGRWPIRALYTTPPKRPWVGLTDEEFDEIWRMDLNNKDIMDKTIAKLRELNT